MPQFKKSALFSGVLDALSVSEKNNFSSADTGLPDLVSNRLVVDDDQIPKGQTLWLYSLISNVGVVDARNFSIGVSIDNLEPFEISVDYLPVGYQYASDLYAYTSNLYIGQHTVTLMVDSKNGISESNEDNNTSSALFTITEALPNDRPELYLDYFFFNGFTDTFFVGDEVNFTFNLFNVGKTSADKETVGIVLDGKRVADLPVDLLNSGSERVLSSVISTDDILPGRHTLGIVADIEGGVNELNEENNILNATFFLKAHNDAPFVNIALENQNSVEGAYFVYALPNDAFIDPNGDSLAYKAKLADGGDLPPWLTFDPYARILSGTVPFHENDLNIVITATDPEGLFVESPFILTTNPPPNNPPEGSLSVNDLSPRVGQLLYAVDSITDKDGIASGSTSYEWQTLSGDYLGSGATFLVEDTLIGQSIRVFAHYTDGFGRDEAMGSWQTEAVLEGKIAYYQGNQYFLSKAANWLDAENEAVQKGGHLISVNDANEQYFAFNTFGEKGQSFWLGLNDIKDEGSFVWPNGEVSSYSFFAPGEPNNMGDEDAVEMYGSSGEWNDVNIASLRQGITEIPNHAPTGRLGVSDETPKESQDLTVVNNIQDEDGLSGSHSYQWIVDSIVVGTGDHLKVTSGFIGKSILVMASYTDGWGKQEQVISDKTQPVISAGLVLTGTKYADVLTGGKYNDQISGLSGNDILSSKNGTDIVKGGTGNDILIGGLGKDALYGGLGNDTFRYESILDSKVSQADDIFDFKIGDKIDLTAIDANLLKTGNQAFKELAVGSLFKSFVNPASLFFDKSTHILYGNIDSDSKPEFSISLLGVNNLVFEDIIA